MADVMSIKRRILYVRTCTPYCTPSTGSGHSLHFCSFIGRLDRRPKTSRMRECAVPPPYLSHENHFQFLIKLLLFSMLFDFASYSHRTIYKFITFYKYTTTSEFACGAARQRSLNRRFGGLPSVASVKACRLTATQVRALCMCALDAIHFLYVCVVHWFSVVVCWRQRRQWQFSCNCCHRFCRFLTLV